MANLMRKAGSETLDERLTAARQKWESSMLRQLKTLRSTMLSREAVEIAVSAGAVLHHPELHLLYWNNQVTYNLKSGEILSAENEPLSTFDSAMVLFYLSSADGTPPADRWIGFRELPDGAFYNQAFQGYSGNLLARRFNNPAQFDQAAGLLHGSRLPDLAPSAWRFLPFPNLPIAAALWPGDDELPTRAAILFDANAGSYMVTDGLALLGSGLARRLIRTVRPDQ